VNLLHIESRSSDRIPDQYEFFVECAPGGNVPKVVEILKSTMTYCSVVSRNNLNDSKVKDSECFQDGLWMGGWRNKGLTWKRIFLFLKPWRSSCSICTVVSVADPRCGQIRQSDSITWSWIECRSSRVYRSCIQNEEEVFSWHRFEL